MKQMRTRCLPSMTNHEVEEYLKRSDIIIIPVGVAEMHGAYPLDCEYVMAEAYARLIAEQVDGLVLPNLVYFHPGATQIGRGTVHMSMENGFRYVTAIAESLLQQGFRRQIYIPGHQPTSQFLLPLITEFFDNNKVPLFYLDMMAYLVANGKMEPLSFEAMRQSVWVTTPSGLAPIRFAAASTTSPPEPRQMTLSPSRAPMIPRRVRRLCSVCWPLAPRCSPALLPSTIPIAATTAAPLCLKPARKSRERAKSAKSGCAIRLTAATLSACSRI